MLTWSLGSRQARRTRVPLTQGPLVLPRARSRSRPAVLTRAPVCEVAAPPPLRPRGAGAADGRCQGPAGPVAGLTRGDGRGGDVGGAPGITTCAGKLLGAGVARAFGGRRKVHGFDVHAGDV